MYRYKKTPMTRINFLIGNSPRVRLQNQSRSIWPSMYRPKISTHVYSKLGSSLFTPQPRSTNMFAPVGNKPAASFWGDSDRDGIMNGLDCAPYNKRKQGMSPAVMAAKSGGMKYIMPVIPRIRIDPITPPEPNKPITIDGPLIAQPKPVETTVISTPLPTPTTSNVNFSTAPSSKVGPGATSPYPLNSVAAIVTGYKSVQPIGRYGGGGSVGGVFIPGEPGNPSRKPMPPRPNPNDKYNEYVRQQGQGYQYDQASGMIRLPDGNLVSAQLLYDKGIVKDFYKPGIDRGTTPPGKYYLMDRTFTAYV